MHVIFHKENECVPSGYGDEKSRDEMTIKDDLKLIDILPTYGWLDI